MPPKSVVMSLKEARGNLSDTYIDNTSMRDNERVGRTFKIENAGKWTPGRWLRLTGPPDMAPQATDSPAKKRKIGIDVSGSEHEDLREFINAEYWHNAKIIQKATPMLFDRSKPMSMDFITEPEDGKYKHPLRQWTDKKGNERWTWNLLVHPSCTAVLRVAKGEEVPEDGNFSTCGMEEGEFDGFRPHQWDKKNPPPPANDLDRNVYHRIWIVVHPMFGYASKVALGYTIVASTIVIDPNGQDGDGPQTTEGAVSELGGVGNLVAKKAHANGGGGGAAADTGADANDGVPVSELPDGYDGTEGSGGSGDSNAADVSVGSGFDGEYADADADADADEAPFPLTQAAEEDDSDGGDFEDDANAAAADAAIAAAAAAADAAEAGHDSEAEAAGGDGSDAEEPPKKEKRKRGSRSDHSTKRSKKESSSRRRHRKSSGEGSGSRRSPTAVAVH